MSVMLLPNLSLCQTMRVWHLAISLSLSFCLLILCLKVATAVFTIYLCNRQTRTSKTTASVIGLIQEVATSL